MNCGTARTQIIINEPRKINSCSPSAAAGEHKRLFGQINTIIDGDLTTHLAPACAKRLHVSVSPSWIWVVSWWCPSGTTPTSTSHLQIILASPTTESGVTKDKLHLLLHPREQKRVTSITTYHHHFSFFIVPRPP
jgi:hypothetical protein